MLTSGENPASLAGAVGLQANGAIGGGPISAIEGGEPLEVFRRQPKWAIGVPWGVEVAPAPSAERVTRDADVEEDEGGDADEEEEEGDDEGHDDGLEEEGEESAVGFCVGH